MMHPQYRSDLLKMAEIFKVLGDPNRLHILSLISHQELCVCEITSILNISQSNASQHLARLRSVDLVKERRNAQWIYYSLNQDAFPLISEILQSLPDVSIELKKIEDLPNHQKCKI
ncbi:MAG: metalloregulator ArsR/SmtB family transcription factor [Candidatus Thermoplasmatota archaeon]|nr:metalloregulator ArsR/SmtB family transcription factor [Candidatus Thermoplasmatota archaeon]